MYVTGLRLDGVRGFHDARACVLDFTRPDGSYAGWTVIAGRNGSGKTTLLRTIALGLAGHRRASQLDGDLEDHLSYGRTCGSLAVDIKADPAFDTGAHSAEDVLTAELLWEPERDSFDADDEPPTELRFRGGGVLDPLLWSSRPPKGWFHAAYGPFRRLTGTGMHERTPPTADRVAALRTLFEEQSALTESVDWLISLHLRELEGEAGAGELLTSVRALLNDGLLPDGYCVMGVNSGGLWLRRSDGTGPVVALRRMSDGLRTVTALVLDIVRHMHAAYNRLELRHDERGDPYLPHPGVVLIDEVDAHLHVSWQQSIGAWFRAHFPAVQFIVSTHSPYICQAADLNGLIQLPGSDDQEPPRVVSEELYGRVVYGTLDDVVLTDLFGIDSLYSDRAEKLRRELVDLEFDVMTGRADEAMVRRHRELRRKLASSQAARVDELSERARRREAHGS
ncbi:AAA family ATPase [Streptomyces sioyaensis]|uniref:AAA family ATPase n=1 Tax=Streptomyces sioyaensis TaxID=67364 RepID=UPI0037D105B7